MGKKLVKNESDIRKKMFMPNRYDILGLVDKHYGFTRMRVLCQDGFNRMSRVRGQLKKRNWWWKGDIVLISPWDFEYEAKGDIIFRYTQNQANWLRNAGLLKLG